MLISSQNPNILYRASSVSGYKYIVGKLSASDPEFYKFLQEEDKNLLNFDESSDEETHQLPDKLVEQQVDTLTHLPIFTCELIYSLKQKDLSYREVHMYGQSVLRHVSVASKAFSHDFVYQKSDGDSSSEDSLSDEGEDDSDSESELPSEPRRPQQTQQIFVTSKMVEKWGQKLSNKPNLIVSHSTRLSVRDAGWDVTPDQDMTSGSVCL